MSAIPLMSEAELEAARVPGSEAGIGALVTANGNLSLRAVAVESRITGLIAQTTNEAERLGVLAAIADQLADVLEGLLETSCDPQVVRRLEVAISSLQDLLIMTEPAPDLIAGVWTELADVLGVIAGKPASRGKPRSGKAKPFWK